MRNLKNFLARSQALDILLALIMAAAVVKLVGSVVVDIVTPLISHFFGGGRDMGNYFIPLVPGTHSDMTYDEAKKIGAVVGYGQFIVALVYFIIAATLVGLIASGLRKEKGAGE